MIRIQQLKLRVGHTDGELEEKICRLLRCKPQGLLSYEIRRRSIDARKKPELYYNYTIDCHMTDQRQTLKRAGKGVCIAQEPRYRFPESGSVLPGHPPVIVGTGPAGLFCGLMLAKYGYRPLLVERGTDVDTRIQDVARFWETGELNPLSNVQFGEGGAGTFSDGKLNTLVKDPAGRNREVLRLFVKAGADASILYDSKPHIGTDALVSIIKNIRKEIQDWGGTVRFNAKVTGILHDKGKITNVIINDTESIPCETVVLAPGHSARDTFQMLFDTGLTMESKEFAAGFRVEHRQSAINLSQYGMADVAQTGAAPYKVTAQTASGRGVYSFCMCPGGWVVNASTEEGRLAVNGMSYSDRAGRNANSAIIVSVKKSDFPSDHPLAGIAFQRTLEEAAYQAGGGKIPVQRLEDFRTVFAARTKESVRMAKTGRSTDICSFSCNQPKEVRQVFRQTSERVCEPFRPCIKGQYVFADLTNVLPEEMTRAFLEGMEQFSHKIKGFADGDTLISAVESRTSSPVRILRDETYQGSPKGVYPCGEGAGYAGGILSAAMDGLRIAETIRKQYCPYT